MMDFKQTIWEQPHIFYQRNNLCNSHDILKVSGNSVAELVDELVQGCASVSPSKSFMQSGHSKLTAGFIKF